MQGLTSANIETIIQEVSRAGISFSHLREELVDHICCEIEIALQQGISFDAAFEKMKMEISPKKLKKIQEDTILLIDKKYRFMKKIMKTFGMISMIMVTMGALFKIQHWPGGGVMLILGFLLLVFLFFPSALWVMKAESKIKGSLFIYFAAIFSISILLIGILFKIQHYPGAGILLLTGFTLVNLLLIPSILVSRLRDTESRHLHVAYIIGALALITYLTGLLFKIQHYPGAGPLLMLGAISITAIFLPIYVKKAYGKAEIIKPGFLFLCVAIIFFNMFNLLLALTVSKDVLGYYVKPGEDVMSTTKIIENKNDQLLNSMIADSSFVAYATEIKASSNDIYNYIEEIKAEIISNAEGISVSEAGALAKNPQLISRKDNYDIPTVYMIGNSQDGSNGKAAELRRTLDNYKSDMLKYTSNDSSASRIVKKILNTDPFTDDIYEGRVTWEMKHFYHLIIISVINKLSCFQRDVRIAELTTLESVKSARGHKEMIIEN